VGQFATVRVKSIVIKQIAHARFRREASTVAIDGSTFAGGEKTSWR
jgi:hypothetical protein